MALKKGGLGKGLDAIFMENITESESEKEIVRLKIDEIEVNFNYKSKYNETEFARQLADQQAGVNKLTVDEYLKNRERYISEGRAIEANAVQQAARKEAQAQKIAEVPRLNLHRSIVKAIHVNKGITATNKGKAVESRIK